MSVYKPSSTAKVEQKEAELSAQLSALRAELEENGFSQGTPSKSYCSVPTPKDVSYFRMEREKVLRRGLQVAEALPVASQAQVMQRELDSCLSLEYTPESLPPLLHQFYADRSYQLAQNKYLLMLRWKRFCRHSHVIDKLYPSYKDQVSYLVSEYEDAVQRARRLAVSREKVLTGRGNPINVVTQEDVVIYLKWLVCHLHSVKTIHHFLRVLHYIPACERKDKDVTRMTREETRVTREVYSRTDVSCTSNSSGETPTRSQYPAEMANDVPMHSVKLEEFGAELQSLLSYFHLPYGTHNINTTADEMELFSMVLREFKIIFRKQEVRKTFLQYDGTQALEAQWGRKGAMALRKEANWTSFIQIKPKRDPWQQKIATKLKELKSFDELLRMHGRFLQVSDPVRVTEALRGHAAQICDPQVVGASSATSHLSTGHHTSQIWTSIYNTATISQESNVNHVSGSSSRRGGSEGQDKRKSKTPSLVTKNESYSYMSSMQLLGLDECPEEGPTDPTMTKGAYLSLIHLRHLKIRELQRVSLGVLNYLHSVERSLTFDTAGLRMEGGELVSSAEETGWMNAARGGGGTAGGLGSQQYCHNTPVDYKVHCSEFMEFQEVENLHDFYSSEEGLLHTQDQRGLYIVYDVALRDFEELELMLTLLGSHYIQRSTTSQQGVKSEASYNSTTDLHSWARTDVDRVAVLLDLWTCEAAFLENKAQLVNCYFEAYQHVSGSEERFALAQVLTDIMHRRPRLELGAGYFAQAYRAETACLQSHQQLIRAVLDCQIDQQRQYLERVWRGCQRGTVHEYGLPPNYVPKHLVSLGGGRPALMNVYLLEVHPSLCLASQVYQALTQAHLELTQLQQAAGVAERVSLEQRLLQQALDHWHSLAAPGASYSTQTQKDLFSDVLLGDPSLVRDVGMSLICSAEEKDMKQGKEKQFFAVETFSKLLELVTLRHRLMESAAETAHLAQLYKTLSLELGFDEFHLYVRPVQFEFAVQRDMAEQRPLFVTALLQDNSSVDRYTPSSLPLSIQELDENQIGKFSFCTEEAVVHLMTRAGIENLQVTLGCQVTQKNAFFGVVKLACLCYWAETFCSPEEKGLRSSGDTNSSARLGPKACEDLNSLLQQADPSSTRGPKTSAPGTRERLAEAFVSVQLEKVGPRDEMLNSFIKKRQMAGSLLKNPDEVAKIKRRLILEFCQKFSLRMSQCCVRGQIIALFYSLTSLLDDLPAIRQSHFMIGQASEWKGDLESEFDLRPDPRSFSRRPRHLLSADGKTVLNLWFIPHFTEVLLMFRTLEDAECSRALHHTLGIVSALHDIVCYLVSFARLGNSGAHFSLRRGREGPELTADWGGAEGIGAELWEIQRQVETLCDPASPAAVGRLLQLRSQVLFLQFDTAVRHLIREAFLSSGNVAAYQSVSDNMGHALPVLSDNVRANVYGRLLPLPQSLEPHCPKARRMYPWRCFLACHGLHPVDIWDIPPIENCMQLCLSGLSSRSRMEANGALLGVSLLMEDVLNSGGEAVPLRLHDNKQDLHEVDCLDGGGDEGKVAASSPTQDPTQVLSVLKDPTQVLSVLKDPTQVLSVLKDPTQVLSVLKDPTQVLSVLKDPTQVLSVLKGFLVLTKQLEFFKESWGRRQLGVEHINTLKLYRHFSRLYRAEVHQPSMRALAQQMGREKDYEAVLLSDDQPLLPPAGATEVDIKTWQLHRLLESTECDMIQAVQRRIAKELTLVISERARQDTGLPTELWKRAPMKHNLSPQRPQIVENFIQQLMEGAEEADGLLMFPKTHLQQCLTSLGGSVMKRERSSFLFYSQFYEQILQQESQLLYQREQDVKNLEESQSQTSDPYNEVTALCRGMMVEVTALRARIAQLEEKHKSQQQQLSLQHRQRYDSLVRQLFSTCIQLKARLDEYHARMDQDVRQLVSKVRREGVDSIIKLKRKFGSTKDDDALVLAQSKNDGLHELSMENRQLTGLLCKVKALSHWRQVVGQGKLHSELLQSQQREMACQREALKVKMTSEEEVALLKEELEATKRAVTQCQTEYSCTKRLLLKQNEELHEVRHRSAQEARSRQELDTFRLRSLEQLREDAGDKDRQLRAASVQLDRSRQETQLQQQRSGKDIRQVRSRLHQERSLKREAFQQVDKLQSQVYDFETAFSGCTSTPGQRKISSYTLADSRSSIRVSSAVPARSRQQSTHPPCCHIRDATQEDLNTESGQQLTDTKRCSDTQLERPKTVPSRLRILTREMLLPELSDGDGGPPSLPRHLQH